MIKNHDVLYIFISMSHHFLVQEVNEIWDNQSRTYGESIIFTPLVQLY